MSEIPKTKNQEKNEAKRLAKLAKFEAKQAKLAAETKGSKKAKKVVKEAVAEPKFENKTPKGAKKDLSHEFQATYQPQAVEAAWYDWWSAQGFFKPQFDSNGKIKPKGTFVIPIPPPNVTGSLHLGHALTDSIQDTMIRWNRMQGKTVLWLPGADHAGIATQVIVEKKLMRDRGVSRHDLGRSEFIKETFKWKDEYIVRIYDQIRALGSSVDWSRVRFTMDESMNRAVNEAFCRLHQDGTIYRANRLVNWCTKLKTALSNLEVENMELEGRTMLSVPDHDKNKKYEFGVLISFAYHVENSDEKIVVATTRLETMLGDTAIAVHPSDKRYQHLHNKFVIHPFNGRRIPILADEYPDPEFGTGAVKITPAHDANDYIVGKRQGVEFINIFTDEGKINENGGAPQFVGMQRFDARVAILEALKARGDYVGTENNKMVIPFCTRSGNIVEPMLKPQWWVSCNEMAGMAVDAVRNGELKITPAASEKEWYRWLEQPQDWCISRQLWWGHRVPAYFVNIEGDANNREDGDRWVSGRSEAEAKELALKKFNHVSPAAITLIQDEDVLDTWFSSGLWPFSTMGWPEKTKDFEDFFPNSLLETGWDILFFWVARMVMMSLKLTGKVPFKDVFCHAMVRDAHGRKMSKSLGNVIDPLDVINGITLEDLQKRLETGNLDPREVAKAKEGQKKDFPNGIPACGTDALRFTLLAYSSFGRDINLDILRVDGYKKFCNKIWNATKFALLKLDNDFIPNATKELTGKESLPDLWILHKLNVAISETNKYLGEMNFMQATTAVYQFWWADLCDVYLEVSKPIIDGDDLEARKVSQNVLYTCLDQGLKLLHPFMPFVTEELYQRLQRRPNDNIPSIMISEYPEAMESWNNLEALDNFNYVNSVVHAGRSLTTNYNVKEPILYVQGPRSDVLRGQLTIMKSLIKKCKSLDVLDVDAPAPNGCTVYAFEETKIFLLVKGIVKIEEELEKLRKKVEKTIIQKDAIIKKQEVQGYAENVAEDIKEIDSSKLTGLISELEALNITITEFERMLE